jgi:hypothetical protein
MQIFRTHIMKWAVSLLLTLGMVAHLAIPYSSEAQKNAFAQWLDRNLVENDNERESTIRSDIRQLPSQHESFPLLLEQASMLVVNHSSNFKLPVEQKNGDFGAVGIWLIEKWTQHQEEAGSMDALLPDTLKSSLKWLLQNNSLTATAGTFSTNPLHAVFSESLNEVLYVAQRLPIPFLSGVSINAP